MARLIKKLWYVKREVIASTLHEALKAQGKVYEIALADDKLWPQNKIKLGFNDGKED